MSPTAGNTVMLSVKASGIAASVSPRTSLTISRGSARLHLPLCRNFSGKCFSVFRDSGTVAVKGFLYEKEKTSPANALNPGKIAGTSAVILQSAGSSGKTPEAETARLSQPSDEVRALFIFFSIKKHPAKV